MVFECLDALTLYGLPQSHCDHLSDVCIVNSPHSCGLRTPAPGTHSSVNLFGPFMSTEGQIVCQYLFDQNILFERYDEWNPTNNSPANII